MSLVPDKPSPPDVGWRYWSPLLLAILVGVVVLGILVLFLARDEETLAVELLVSIIVGVVFFVGTALFGHKVTFASDLIGKKTCPKCIGIGHFSQTCPQCKGKKSISRPATFGRIGPSSAVRFELNPVKTLGHWQDVTVGVQNTDVAQANYAVRVSVPGASSGESASDTFALAPGGSATTTFKFKIHGTTPYDVSFNVDSSPIVVPCPGCGASGTVVTECPECRGARRVPRIP